MQTYEVKLFDADNNNHPIPTPFPYPTNEYNRPYVGQMINLQIIVDTEVHGDELHLFLSDNPTHPKIDGKRIRVRAEATWHDGKVTERWMAPEKYQEGRKCESANGDFYFIGREIERVTVQEYLSRISSFFGALGPASCVI